MRANWIAGAALAAGLACVVSAQQGVPVKYPGCSRLAKEFIRPCAPLS